VVLLAVSGRYSPTVFEQPPYDLHEVPAGSQVTVDSFGGIKAPKLAAGLGGLRCHGGGHHERIRQ
jgi:hypothetical protein